MNISEDNKLTVLNDHYKDSRDLLGSFLKLRDRMFGLALVIIAIMLFQIFLPKESCDVFSKIITSKLSLESPINLSFISGLLWSILLSLIVRYFQTVIHINRQYDYLHSVEEELSRYYNGKVFTREGKAYLKNYSWFSDWAHILYTMIFPLILLVIIIVKIISEWFLVRHLTSSLVFNSLMFIFLLISIILYLLSIHFKK